MTQQPLEFVTAEAQLTIHRRLADLLADKTMLPCDKAVMIRLMSFHAYGAAKALSIAAMQFKWKADGQHVWPDRAVKQAVKNLLEKYDLPIGACRIAPHNGYYFVISDEDAEAAVRPLKAEIFSMFRRIKVLSPRSAFVRRLQGQIDLLMEDEP
jgi:hypothetical protein